jgi:PIN domain nuclease of toxin-antitoxin system
MSLLLDTHALIWLIWGNPRLSQRALETIQTPELGKWVSMATFWELAIKIGLGKLDLGLNWRHALQNRLEEDGIGLLSIAARHCERVASLPRHHRDPFDRMLVAQAESETLTLISRDAVFDRYGIERIW